MSVCVIAHAVLSHSSKQHMDRKSIYIHTHQVSLGDSDAILTIAPIGINAKNYSKK